MSQEAASAANGLKTAYDAFIGGVSNLESEIGKGVANFENTQTVFGNNFNTSEGTGNSDLEKLRSQELENAKLKAEKTDPFSATIMAGASGAASSLTFGLINSKLAEDADPALADYDAMSEVYMSEHPIATQVGNVAGQLPYMALGLGEVGGVNSLDEVNVVNDEPSSVQHAVENAKQVQSVLDGIDPQYFNSNSRFGGGFYVGADSDTVVAELTQHGNSAKYAISYDMNIDGEKVLDLTNSEIASEWHYTQNLTSTKACQKIGELARSQGYNVIKFQSYRSDGINYVIYDNFESILNPRIVTPVG